MTTRTTEPGRVLLLWNQVEEDVYEQWREQGPKTLAWDPEKQVPDVGTVAEEMKVLFDAVRAGGHELIVVNLEDDLATLLSAIEDHEPDVIFNLVEFFGEDAGHEAHVAGIYEMLEVPYTGSRPAALMACQRKHRTKAILRDAGVPTANSIVVSGRRGHENIPADHGLRFPVIVKPSMEDASGGIDLDCVIYEPAMLAPKVAQMLADYEMPILIEEYIDGREVHCAILGNDPAVTLPLFEMEFSDRVDEHGKPMPKIITFRAKWDPHSKDFYAMDSRCPAVGLDPATEQRIAQVARHAYFVMGCRDYARIDLRLDAAGNPYVLEVNPNPDLTDGSAFIQCATASGRTFADTINEIIGFALGRARAPVAVDFGPTDQLLREHLTEIGEPAAPRKKPPVQE